MNSFWNTNWSCSRLFSLKIYWGLLLTSGAETQAGREAIRIWGHTNTTSNRPPSTQSIMPGGLTGSPGQGGNPLLTPELAAAHHDALRVVRLAAYQALLNAKQASLNANTTSSTIGSTTIFPPHSGQSLTINEGRTRAEQLNVPSSSSPSVLDTEGREYILREQDTGLPPAPSIHTASLPYTQAGSTPTQPPGKGKSTASRHGKRKQTMPMPAKMSHGHNSNYQLTQIYPSNLLLQTLR